MALPVLIAWGESDVFRFSESPDTWWGFEFELIEGASGFTAQNRLHGFCGFRTHIEAEPDDIPAILTSGVTEPAQLEPYIDEILASYRSHLKSMGLLHAEA